MERSGTKKGARRMLLGVLQARAEQMANRPHLQPTIRVSVKLDHVGISYEAFSTSLADATAALFRATAIDIVREFASRL